MGGTLFLEQKSKEKRPVLDEKVPILALFKGRYNTLKSQTWAVSFENIKCDVCQRP